MRTLSYRILLRREPEGGYTVLVPSLPGCITYGKTVEEAIEMAKDAINIPGLKAGVFRPSPLPNEIKDYTAGKG